MEFGQIAARSISAAAVAADLGCAEHTHNGESLWKSINHSWQKSCLVSLTESNTFSVQFPQVSFKPMSPAKVISMPFPVNELECQSFCSVPSLVWSMKQCILWKILDLEFNNHDKIWLAVPEIRNVSAQKAARSSRGFVPWVNPKYCFARDFSTWQALVQIFRARNGSLRHEWAKVQRCVTSMDYQARMLCKGVRLQETQTWVHKDQGLSSIFETRVREAPRCLKAFDRRVSKLMTLNFWHLGTSVGLLELNFWSSETEPSSKHLQKHACSRMERHAEQAGARFFHALPSMGLDLATREPQSNDYGLPKSKYPSIFCHEMMPMNLQACWTPPHPKILRVTWECVFPRCWCLMSHVAQHNYAQENNFRKITSVMQLLFCA